MPAKLILNPPEIDLDYHGDVVVFDLDDTLYPERDYMISGFRAVANRAVSSEEATAFANEMTDAFDNGGNAMNHLADLLNLPLSEREHTIAEWVDIYRNHQPKLSLNQEVADVLLELSQRGVELALITDGRSTAQRAKIHALGLQRFFAPDNIYISEERGAGKESMEPFAYMVHCYPEAAGFTYVADNPVKDFLFPNLMGWTTICLADKGLNIHPQNMDVSKEYKPAFQIQSIKELLNKDYKR